MFVSLTKVSLSLNHRWLEQQSLPPFNLHLPRTEFASPLSANGTWAKWELQLTSNGNELIQVDARSSVRLRVTSPHRIAPL